LMVSPEHQRQGYGSRLLAAIETAWPHQRYELFTSDRSIANIRLYEKTGYRFFREKLIRPGLRFVYMEKVLKHA
ncbi:MAG: GNAT family N-acetyltransferase, partial [Deltaproteobacteria bacterium]|nr:GNAT family N-acetyltransferase [Deltaproteobacteria bacterium]